MAKKPLFARFIGLWIVLISVTAVSFYLALLLRVAHPMASLVCMTVALLCFGAVQIPQFSRMRFVLRAVKEQKRKTAEASGSTDTEPE